MNKTKAELIDELEKLREQFENLKTTLIEKEYIETIINQLPIPIAILKVITVNGEYQYIYEFINEAISKLNNKTVKDDDGHVRRAAREHTEQGSHTAQRGAVAHARRDRDHGLVDESAHH